MLRVYFRGRCRHTRHISRKVTYPPQNDSVQHFVTRKAVLITGGNKIPFTEADSLSRCWTEPYQLGVREGSLNSCCLWDPVEVQVISDISEHGSSFTYIVKNAILFGLLDPENDRLWNHFCRQNFPLNFHDVLTEILAPNMRNDSVHTTALQSMHFKAEHNTYCL